MPVTKVKSSWQNGSLVFTEEGDARLVLPSVTYETRQRFTTAEINAGVTVLPALEGFSYRLVDAILIAVGGNAATATSVRINGTVSSSTVRLVTAAVAGLARSVIARIGGSNIAALADGASFVTLDANTAITADVDNGNLATATHIDVILRYAIEPAA